MSVTNNTEKLLTEPTGHQEGGAIDRTPVTPATPKASQTPQVSPSKAEPCPWNGGQCFVGATVTALGVTIGEIVHNTNKVFVFLDEFGNVEWLWDEKNPPHLMWASARVVELESKCTFFRQGGDYDLFAHRKAKPEGRMLPRAALWCRGFLKRRLGTFDFARHELSAKRFIAQGIATLYEGGTKDEAEAAFTNAEKFITQRGREASLVWLYRVFGRLAILSALMLLWILPAMPQTDIFWATLSCVAAGGLGAYVSRALASRESLPCDANAGRRLHTEEAILRWAVGSVAGGLICLLLQSKVLLGTLPTDKGGFPIALALALLAGTSERFLPTLLNHFDDQLAEKKSTAQAAEGKPAGKTDPIPARNP